MLKANKIYTGKGIKSSIVIDSNVFIDAFDPSSPNHSGSIQFLEYILDNNVLFAMPMHGWFEINCTLNRIKNEKGIEPPIIAGRQQAAIEFIHIDDQFLQNYSDVDVPVIKAMDHLFLVVAKKNYLQLVTWDKQMTRAGRECGVDVLNPAEWMQSITGSQQDVAPDALGTGDLRLKKMNKKPNWPSNDDLVGYFSKHLIPVYFTFAKDETKYSRYFTSFLISIDDRWFIITAGHCMEDVDRNIKEGYEIDRCRLIDSGGLEAKHNNPIPFDYSGASKMHVDIEGLDLGVIAITDYYKAQLEANNVKPLSEKVWGNQPDNPDFYMLLGVPNQLTEIKDDNFIIRTTLHNIKPLDQKPSNFKDSKAPMFYGEIRLDDTLTDIKGMSGGPIFSFQRNDAGEVKYWLHAVQSNWLPSDKYIAGCLTAPLIAQLKDIIDKLESETEPNNSME